MADKDVISLQRSDWEVRCPFNGDQCTAPPFSLVEISAVCRDAEALQAFVRVREELAAERIRSEKDEELRRTLVILYLIICIQ